MAASPLRSPRPIASVGRDTRAPVCKRPTNAGVWRNSRKDEFANIGWFTSAYMAAVQSGLGSKKPDYHWIITDRSSALPAMPCNQHTLDVLKSVFYINVRLLGRCLHIFILGKGPVWPKQPVSVDFFSGGFSALRWSPGMSVIRSSINRVNIKSKNLPSD
jgi:hypothetical protein